MRKRMILVFAIVFVVVLGWLMWHGRVSSPMARLERELERLRKAGEPTRWEDIAPPVPKHLDGTPLLLKAIEQLGAAEQKFPPDVWVTYNAQVLEAARPALKTLREALAFPRWRSGNPEVFLTALYFREFQEFARLLSAEALQRKRKGDMDEALESCQTILKLCRHMDDEPHILSFHVQMEIFCHWGESVMGRSFVGCGRFGDGLPSRFGGTEGVGH
jgi:hypothetical protein